VDLGLIDENGQQVSYVGPYNLKGVNYAEQAWFQRARIKGVYVSEVFMGFRKFPHVAIAVQRIADDGTAWIVRATIDTDQFDRLIAAMGLDPESDAFLVNAQGALQTASRFHGAILEKAPWQIPASGYEPGAFDARDPQGRDVIVAHAALVNADFTLVAVKPRAEVFRPWTTFRGELFLLFGGSTLFIVTVVALLVDVLIRRMRESDEKRVAAFARMEHANKLSSIGRLAAGVAHEINNPLAIIFEKAGLMQDVLGLTEDFPQKDRFLKLVAAVVRSVERCRSITHRLLGFSRRMDESFEPLDVNDALAETLGFLEKEAANRDIVVDLDLEPGLPRVVSDRGQMQQVFLNILNNAFAAVPDGGRVEVSTARQDQHLGGLGGLGETVTVTIADNGKGMSPEILEHIFEPFYSTKGAMGTGLGMFITYGIIKRLGGDILVDSAEGRGTRVRVLLPVNAQAPLPEAV
jgi:two-component system NtrC family sensor kinase